MLSSKLNETFLRYLLTFSRHLSCVWWTLGVGLCFGRDATRCLSERIRLLAVIDFGIVIAFLATNYAN